MKRLGDILEEQASEYGDRAQEYQNQGLMLQANMNTAMRDKLRGQGNGSSFWYHGFANPNIGVDHEVNLDAKRQAFHPSGTASEVVDNAFARAENRGAAHDAQQTENRAAHQAQVFQDNRFMRAAYGNGSQQNPFVSNNVQGHNGYTNSTPQHAPAPQGPPMMHNPMPQHVPYHRPGAALNALNPSGNPQLAQAHDALMSQPQLIAMQQFNNNPYGGGERYESINQDPWNAGFGGGQQMGQRMQQHATGVGQQAFGSLQDQQYMDEQLKYESPEWKRQLQDWYNAEYRRG